MTKLADDHPIAQLLAWHLEICDLGERNCIDCRLADDTRALSAIAIASYEVDQVRPWLNTHPDTCTYCGDGAEHRDHLVPRPWTGDAVRRYVPTVPACSDCNVRINAAPVFTIAGRAEIAASSLRQKWRKQLAIPDRTPEQLREFSGKMRHNIAAAQVRRQALRRRRIILDSGGAPFVPEALLAA